MTIKSIASVIQKILYSRRMFPYYTWVVLGGVEADGLTFSPFTVEGTYAMDRFRLCVWL